MRSKPRTADKPCNAGTTLRAEKPLLIPGVDLLARRRRFFPPSASTLMARGSDIYRGEKKEKKKRANSERLSARKARIDVFN
jgi:hypothetical protein